MHSVTCDASGSGADSLLALPQPFLKNNCTVQISQLFTICGFKKWKKIPPSFPRNWRETLDFQAQILEHPFCGTNINSVCTTCLTFTVTNDYTYYLNFAIISLYE